MLIVTLSIPGTLGTLNLFKFHNGIPEPFFEIDNQVIFNNDSFIFQKLFHCGGISKMVFSCKQSITVNNPVGRYKISIVVANIKRPTYHTG